MSTEPGLGGCPLHWRDQEIRVLSETALEMLWGYELQ